MKLKNILRVPLDGVWMFTLLTWPVLKWVCSLEVLFQIIRAVYHWETPGMHHGWTALMHFLAFSALHCFVTLYQPEWFKNEAQGQAKSPQFSR